MYVVDTVEEAMALAIEVAKAGEKRGHRPFGALVYDTRGQVLAMDYGTESAFDPTRHSELLVIKQACKRRGQLLRGCTLVSTHQPCPMCAGAITHAKVSRVVFGTWRADFPVLFRAKKVAYDVLLDTSEPPMIFSGVMHDECMALFARESAAALAGVRV